jgi:hypothetical protein
VTGVRRGDEEDYGYYQSTDAERKQPAVTGS